LEDLKNDGANLKSSLENDWMISIESNSTSLQKDEKQLEAKLQTLNVSIANWKKDIIEKEEALKSRENYWNRESVNKKQFLEEGEKQLKAFKETLNGKRNEQLTILKQKQQELKEISELEEIVSQNYKEKVQECQQSLTNYAEKREKDLTEKRLLKTRKLEEFKTIKQTFQKDLDEKRQICERNLNETKEHLLVQLKSEILKENSDSPEDLTELFLQENTLELSRRLKLIIEESTSRMNAIKKGLTKSGYDISAEELVELANNKN